MKRVPKIIIAVVVILLGAGIVFGVIRSRGGEEEARTTTVSRGTVTQDVSFTGRIFPARSSDVSFSAAGVISAIHVKAGEVVQAGQLLASLDPRTAQLDVAKAKADLASAQEETRLTWEKTKVEYEKVKGENTQLIEEQKQRVRDAKAELDQALSAYQTRADDEGDDSYLAKAAYASYLSARSAYNNAQESLTTLQKTVAKSNASAKAASDVAGEQHVSTTQAASTTAGLSSLGALQQRSAVTLSQYNLYAPFAGTVTTSDVEVGEYATSAVSAFTVETTAELQVKADVTESDTIKLAVGMSADISFDAIPDQTSPAQISYIAPSAKIVEGVPVYEVTLQLSSVATNVRPGLTSDVTVHANKVDNTLFIPRRALIQKDGKTYVHILGSDGLTQEQEIETGLIGSTGSIEVTYGLSEGQTIVLSRPDGE
ncbi:MAG: efflux RND transporter periplasmic adaptor subunit [Candidatus Andersenbacteria bacterium]|nr:efflux RND transporter periplasmic adaptor subunit [Candidatus Andersenbacteria bacterium]MBI3250708.1 efflux RND transporter periplasmic adaptor subunit [Candidatus Andersenbacteria bacterium]